MTILLNILFMLFIVLFIAFCTAALADIFISFKARRFSYDDPARIPACRYALLLGTAKYLGEHQALNRYYRYRIDAAVELWRAGKISAIVVSGSGLQQSVSETVCMQADLVAAGVPEEAIWQDPAGLRTLDSIIRFKEAFGDSGVCIISQPFHNQRALVQAQFHGLHATAYNARIIGWRAGFKIHLRERLARLRLWYDLLRHTPPQHYLSEVPIAKHPTKHGA